MPVQVEVSPSEWAHVYPLREIAEYMKNRSREASRHDVTHWLSIIEDYVMRNLGKSATVVRVLQDFERRFGFSDEGERDRIAKMVVRVVEMVYSVEQEEPEKLFQFVKTLRNVVLGIFFGYIDPILPSQDDIRT